MRASNLKQGITLIELMVVISILVVLAAIIMVSFRSIINRYNLEKSTNGIITLLEKARVQSTNSKNGSKYSVYFSPTEAVLYAGTTYSPTATSNLRFEIGNGVEIATTSFAVGTNTVTFERINGTTYNWGSMKLWIINATSASSTIIIGETGIIESR